MPGGLELALRHIDVPAAVSGAADAPLEEWDKNPTETIRLLSKVAEVTRTEEGEIAAKVWSADL